MRSKGGTEGIGTGKLTWRRGKAKGGQPTHQTVQARPGRASKEIGKDKEDRNMATTPVEGEGAAGNEPGYNPTPEDLRLREVYGDWVHANPGTHLDGGIRDNLACQVWWRDLTVMPLKRYDAPSGRVRLRFVSTLVVELKGVQARLWNLERFIIF